jgi:hypothetical protein
MSLALSSAQEPVYCAAWLEGFLSGSGLVLVHDPRLWQIVDAWVMQLAPERFTEVLPLLRRTFSTFRLSVRPSAARWASAPVRTTALRRRLDDSMTPAALISSGRTVCCHCWRKSWALRWYRECNSGGPSFAQQGVGSDD